MENIIRVYCGESVEDKCGDQKHPLNDVRMANEIVESKQSIDCYSNSPDFVSAIKYLAEKKSINIEFFLDGESVGDDIEPIFANFNSAFDLLNNLLQ